jgi:hypothetical protein
MTGERAKAEDMVIYFYKTLHGSEEIGYEPTKGEKALAEKYLKTAGESGLKQIIDETIQHAKQTNWAIRSFGAIKVQAPKTMITLETKKGKSQKERLEKEYQSFIDQEVEKYWNSLPVTDKNRLENREKDQLLAITRRDKIEGDNLERMLDDRIRGRIAIEIKLPSFEEWEENK